MDTAAIHKQIGDLLGPEKGLRIKATFFTSITFLNDSVIYLNPMGTLHLFEIKLDSVPKVKKLSNGIYHGHNFQRYNFIYDSEIYSFGGEGLFNQFTKLTKFDLKAKEWFIVAIKNYPNDIHEIKSSWLYNDTLNFVYTAFKRDGTGNQSQKLDLLYGKIDMLKLNYTCGAGYGTINIEGLASNSDQIFESDRYQLFSSEEAGDNRCLYRLFDKQEKCLFRSKFLNNKPCVNGASFCYIIDDKLFFNDVSGLVDSITIHMKNTHKEHPVFPEIDVEVQEVDSVFIYVMFFLFFIGLGIWVYWKFYWISNKSSGDYVQGLIAMEGELFKLKGSVISRDTLDVLFGIDHFTADTTKAKRSVLIRDISGRGKVKISRERNKVDKRYFKYFIQ